ncbi:MAG: coenzyme F420-0:L-glutamate ligase [Micromonosporaceae bacterium]
MLEILPVRGIGEVRPGDDLAALIAHAAPWLRDGDVLVVTSKIVSKAEGRLVEVPADGPEREAARAQALTAETARPVARRGNTRIVQTHHGYVMASAGIDESNVDRTCLVLLPKDPDASARGLRAALRERAGVDVAVIVSDTMGRPWRLGLVDVALGAAGIDPLRDHRGEIDPYGNELRLTEMAVVDELAAAAELVKGKCDGVPVAVVRGLPRGRRSSGPGYADGEGADPAGDGPGAAALIRPAEQDLFSLGTAEATALGLRTAATLADAPAGAVDRGAVDRGAVGRALALVRPVAAASTVFTVDGDAVACGVTNAADPATLVALGADVHRLRAALLAEGVPSAWRPTGEPATGLIGHVVPVPTIS